jgi:protein arginine kinase activator
MLCCVCKQNEAKVHLTQIANDKVQKVDLCEACAKEKGVNDPTGFSLADLLLGMGGKGDPAPSIGASETLACPRCGFTQADFKKTGRLGCAECYGTFSEGLGGLLKSMHKGTRHVGKTPAGIPAPTPAPIRAPKPESARPEPAKPESPQRLRTLQARLTKAIESEDFEQAAKLRDEIKALSAPPASAST